MGLTLYWSVSLNPAPFFFFLFPFLFFFADDDPSSSSAGGYVMYFMAEIKCKYFSSFYVIINKIGHVQKFSYSNRFRKIELNAVPCSSSPPSSSTSTTSVWMGHRGHFHIALRPQVSTETQLCIDNNPGSRVSFTLSVVNFDLFLCFIW